jgi:ribosome-interacting GTPase 1
MTIENRRQLENTRMKLRELEDLYARTQQGPAASEHARALTLRSLKKRINRFKEELASRPTSAPGRHLKKVSGRVGKGPDGFTFPKLLHLSILSCMAY